MRLDHDSGPVCQPVQLALPGDLIGTEALCGQPYQLSASAFTRCRLEAVRTSRDAAPEPLLRQALLQQLVRCQDMAQLRTGSVLQRLTHLLGLMGLELAVQDSGQQGQAEVVRQALPRLKDVALLVDAKTETVCRSLGQLLPPRRRKSGPAGAARCNLSSSAPRRRFGEWASNASPVGIAA